MENNNEVKRKSKKIEDVDNNVKKSGIKQADKKSEKGTSAKSKSNSSKVAEKKTPKSTTKASSKAETGETSKVTTRASSKAETGKTSKATTRASSKAETGKTSKVTTRASSKAETGKTSKATTRASSKSAAGASVEKSKQIRKKIAEDIEQATSEKTVQIKITKKTTPKISTKKELETEHKSRNRKSVEKKVSKPSQEEYKKKVDINFIEDELEEKFDINKLDDEIKSRKFVSTKDKVVIIKNSFYNMIFAMVFILFLVFCNYGFYHIPKNAMIKNIGLFSFLFLGISILFIEASYKEEKINKCINGIETLAIGIFSLFLPYILQIYTADYIKSLFIAGEVIFGYYFVKCIVSFMLNRRDFLRAKDDISKEDKKESELEEDDDINE